MSSRMTKRSSDDDDAISMGDDVSHSYDDHRHEEDIDVDEEEQEQRQRQAACDVQLSLSLSCRSSSTSISSSYNNRIEADQQEASVFTTAPPHKRRRRRRRRVQDDDVFECQTCGRRFPTFQALGGHRTSHLRRPAMTKKPPPSSKAVHACAICGLGFSTGQALGGHMRRHRMGRADSMAGFPSPPDVDLTQIIVHGRPSSPSSLKLLNLFV